ncbi:hypothetical protein Taro_048498, partial [Colocasia esculenta]|nr:hypothetical protein [Colocasia esculenta]
MGLRQCDPQEWCWLVSTVSCLVLVERQLDLTSMAARLGSSPVWFVWVNRRCGEPVLVTRGSFPTEPVTREAHPYPFQVRESRRLRTRRLVLSRTVAEQGLHLQQCNFLSLYTSGYAPVSFIFLRTCVNDIPCEASARSREAESDQAHLSAAAGCASGRVGNAVLVVPIASSGLPLLPMCFTLG